METNLLTQLLDGVKFSKDCKISGGKLPKDFEATVTLTCDFTGCTVGKALQSFAMPHLAVIFQRARDTLTKDQLVKLASSGYTTLATDAGKAYKDPEQEMIKLYPTMNDVQKSNFLRSIGVEPETVIQEPMTETIEEVREDVKEVETKLRKKDEGLHTEG